MNEMLLRFANVVFVIVGYLAIPHTHTHNIPTVLIEEQAGKMAVSSNGVV